jgi:hypothetical protein
VRKVNEIKFRARIAKDTVVPFTLGDLVNPNPLFSIRQLLIPWLRAGNKPDVFTGETDRNDREIYENDPVRWLGDDSECYRGTIKFRGIEEDTLFLSGFYVFNIETITAEARGEGGELKEGWNGELEVIEEKK